MVPEFCTSTQQGAPGNACLQLCVGSLWPRPSPRRSARAPTSRLIVIIPFFSLFVLIGAFMLGAGLGSGAISPVLFGLFFGRFPTLVAMAFLTLMHRTGAWLALFPSMYAVMAAFAFRKADVAGLFYSDGEPLWWWVEFKRLVFGQLRRGDGWWRSGGGSSGGDSDGGGGGSSGGGGASGSS